MRETHPSSRGSCVERVYSVSEREGRPAHRPQAFGPAGLLGQAQGGSTHGGGAGGLCRRELSKALGGAH